MMHSRVRDMRLAEDVALPGGFCGPPPSDILLDVGAKVVSSLLEGANVGCARPSGGCDELGAEDVG